MLKLITEMNGLIHEISSRVLYRFSSISGAKITNTEVINCSRVEDFYGLSATEKIFEHISEQTNLC